MQTRYLFAPALVAGALLLGACSSDHSSMDMGNGTMADGMAMTDEPVVTIPADATFNATDVAFARGMIVHHTQAVEMSDLALGRAVSPQLTDLATRIKAAQAPEIAQMTSWLTAWGQPVPGTTVAMDMDMDMDMNMDMGGEGAMPMEGMMSAGDMARLDQAQGTEFEREFYQQMIRHHRGALTMAQAQIDRGKDTAAVALANAIIASQAVEIAEMEALLATLA